MKKYNLLIISINSYKIDLINSTVYYAKKRNFTYHISDIKNLKKLNLGEFDIIFFYLNFLLLQKNIDILKSIDKNIPLVFDLDNPLYDCSFLLEHKKVIFRSAFGQKKPNININQIVPLLPYPIKKHNISMYKKDVIMLDVKPFHDAADTHFYILSMLSHLAREWKELERIIGHKLYLYLTTFMKLEQYKNIFNSLIEQSQFPHVNKELFKILEDRNIENIESNKKFKELKYRTRLFITEHGNIADADLVHAICLKTPILTYKRFLFTKSSGFHHSSPSTLKLLNKNISKTLKTMNKLRLKEEYGLRKIITIDQVNYWNNKEYEQMFLKSYDIIFDDFFNHTSNNKITKNMYDGYFRQGIELDEEGFKTLEKNVKVKKK